MFNNLSLPLRAVLKSAFITLFFLLVYVNHNNEHVREGVGDKGFDILNKYVLSTQRQSTADAPPVLLFTYDDAYMKEHKLLDADGHTNYGNVFHRSRIVKFIEVLDKRTTWLKKHNRPLPKALFIDFDFSFTLLPDGKEPSEEDKAFIEILKVERDYVVILAKTQTANFVEQYDDETIQDLIKKGKILFGTVGLNRSLDNTVRRYRAYEHYEEQEQNSTYVNANIMLWKLSKNEELNSSKTVQMFKHREDVVKNRILFKGHKEDFLAQSYWQGYKHYSVLRHEAKKDKIVHKYYENAIVMLGTSYKNNADRFNILNFFGSQSMSGVEIHANTLMTLFHFDGQLLLLPLCFTLLLVFVLVFMVDMLLAITLTCFDIKESNWTLLAMLIIATMFMSLCSLFFLELGYWFDWFAPTVLFDILI